MTFYFLDLDCQFFAKFGREAIKKGYLTARIRRSVKIPLL
jgi:hypothetical protein